MKGSKKIFTKLFFVFLTIALLSGSITPSTMAQDQTPEGGSVSDINVINEYYSEQYITLDDDTEVTRSIINGPSTPPFGQDEWIHADDLQPEGIIPDFPSYDWVFGCTAVSAAMIAAYQDRTSWPNIYTGPTNGGIMPLSNVWGTWTDRTGTRYPSNPLIASQNGIDGRTSRGSIEDYWVEYGSSAQDPFIGKWPEHTYGTAIGDYMRTSQSSFENVDGASSIYNWTSIAGPLTCAEAASRNWADANLGRMRFYQQRGYEVTSCYNQRTDNQVSGGFTLAQFKAEIDAGYPVMVHVVGHTMVGYGYEGNTIYIRDTWDNDPNHTYTMTWGGSYKNMQMHSVSVLRLKRPTPPGSRKLLLPVVLSPDYAFKNWDFELGRVGWHEYSQSGEALILPASSFPGTVRPYGNWAVWLGGMYSDVSSISQHIFVPSQKLLTAKIWIASQETNCGNDLFIARVNGAEIGRIGLCQANKTDGWTTLYVNVSSYAGQEAFMTFEVRTNSSLNSNVFLDNFVWASMLNEELEGLKVIPGDQTELVPESALPKER